MSWLNRLAKQGRALIGALLLLLASIATANAQAVNLSNLPAHPRFFLTPDRLVQLRTEIVQGQRKYDMFREIKRRADGALTLQSSTNIDKIMCLLLVGLVNQDNTYIDKAKTFYMQNVANNYWPAEEIYWNLCYDWIYAYLSPTERDQVADRHLDDAARSLVSEPSLHRGRLDQLVCAVLQPASH